MGNKFFVHDFVAYLGKEFIFMAKEEYTDIRTPFLKLREDYNETHNKMLSQEAIGKICNVSKSTINRIENGLQPPTTEVVKGYSQFFGVTQEYLTGATPPKAINSLHEIGISKEVISTYQKINDLSNRDENILAVLNSLIGNEQYTMELLESILQYLVGQELNGSNRKLDDFLTEKMLKYVNDIMKLQLQKVIKSNINFMGSIGNMDISHEE